MQHTLSQRGARGGDLPRFGVHPKDLLFADQRVQYRDGVIGLRHIELDLLFHRVKIGGLDLEDLAVFGEDVRHEFARFLAPSGHFLFVRVEIVADPALENAVQALFL